MSLSLGVSGKHEKIKALNTRENTSRVVSDYIFFPQVRFKIIY